MSVGQQTVGLPYQPVTTVVHDCTEPVVLAFHTLCCAIARWFNDAQSSNCHMTLVGQKWHNRYIAAYWLSVATPVVPWQRQFGGSMTTLEVLWQHQ